MLQLPAFQMLCSFLLKTLRQSMMIATSLYSSPGPVGISAILLKNCASELCLPIKNDMVRVV